MLFLQQLGVGQAVGNGKTGHEHRLPVTDPANHLVGIVLELAQLNTLFQLHSLHLEHLHERATPRTGAVTNLGQIFQVDFAVVQELQQDLHSGLRIALCISHHADSGVLKHLYQLLALLQHLVCGVLHLRDTLVVQPEHQKN